MKLLDLFRLLFKKNEKKETDKNNSISHTEIKSNREIKTMKNSKPQNYVEVLRTDLDSEKSERMRKKFIAFDVETTGFNQALDRIVEIGAVIFEDGEITKTFSSLVNPGVLIPKAATEVNHITNEMLADAPTEQEVYPKLIEFLGDALDSNTLMCAHNASFDFGFLGHTLYRLGYDAKISYLDTLKIARQYLQGVKNYKQKTLEEHFGLENLASHRASSDAENCGYIMLRLLDAANETFEREKIRIAECRPDEMEREVCAYIQDTISRNGGNAKHIRFQKNVNGYVTVYCYYDLLRRFLRFKFTKKGNYIIVKENYVSHGHNTEKCSQSEGDETFLRFFFKSPFELEAVEKYIYKEYSDCLYDLEQFTSYRECEKKDVEYSLRFMTALSDDDASSLLKSAVEHDRERGENEKRKEEEEKRKAEEKAKNEAERKAKREAILSAPKKPKGKAVLQMDDDGNIIKEFETIAHAAREIGIDNKCISDATKGKQKHAGGYRWELKENKEKDDQ